MKFKAALVLFIIFTIGANALAIEDIKKITIEEALKIATDNSIELDTQKLNVEIAKNSIKAANRLQNPSIKRQ